MTQIAVFKFASGEEVIASYQETSDKCFLTDAMSLQIAHGPSGVETGFVNWPTMVAPGSDLEIFKSSLIGAPMTPHPAVEAQYKSMTSRIITPAEPKIILG